MHMHLHLALILVLVIKPRALCVPEKQPPLSHIPRTDLGLDLPALIESGFLEEALGVTSQTPVGS